MLVYSKEQIQRTTWRDSTALALGLFAGMSILWVIFGNELTRSLRFGAAFGVAMGAFHFVAFALARYFMRRKR